MRNTGGRLSLVDLPPAPAPSGHGLPPKATAAPRPRPSPGRGPFVSETVWPLPKVLQCREEARAASTIRNMWPATRSRSPKASAIAAPMATARGGSSTAGGVSTFSVGLLLRGEVHFEDVVDIVRQ